VTKILGLLKDTDSTDIAADLYGTINWGDGSPVADVTIDGGHGLFHLRGWHQYPAHGTYQIRLSVTDVASGKTAKVTDPTQLPAEIRGARPATRPGSAATERQPTPRRHCPGKRCRYPRAHHGGVDNTDGRHEGKSSLWLTPP
jgi:hypothetical protein